MVVHFNARCNNDDDDKDDCRPAVGRVALHRTRVASRGSIPASPDRSIEILQMPRRSPSDEDETILLEKRVAKPPPTRRESQRDGRLFAASRAATFFFLAFPEIEIETRDLPEKERGETIGAAAAFGESSFSITQARARRDATGNGMQTEGAN